MKKILIILTVFLLLILDYAALDDITTGNQPTFIFEYLTIILSLVIFTGMVHILKRLRL